jgi:hypothetical protein
MRGIVLFALPAPCAMLRIGRSGWICTSIFRVMSPTLLLLSYRPGGREGMREDWNDGMKSGALWSISFPSLHDSIVPSNWRFREDLHLVFCLRKAVCGLLHHGSVKWGKLPACPNAIWMIAPH